MGLFSGIIGGIIGWYLGGPWGARIGFYLGYDASTEGGLFDVYQEDILESALGMDYDLNGSPTYNHANMVGNTISEDVPVARCYGKCKIGANKLRFNDPSDSDLRVIFAHCIGPVNGITEWKINNIAWGDLTGSHTKSEYTGTRTQTADGRFASRACAYRGIAYTAATFTKNDRQIGYDPRMTVVMEGLKCAPLAGGADAFTRNNAVILYDWYLNVEGYSAGDLDLNAFKSLEALCDAVPSGGSIARYRFDFNIDTNQAAINDSKKMLWRSFNGRVIMSQGKLKPVWDSGQMADGAGGLTAKTVSHAFNEDNIVRGSLTWHQPAKYNIVRIHYLDSAKDYKKTSVEEKNERDIKQNGEILYEETCYYITDSEIARRRAKFKFNKFKYTDYEAQLSAFSGAGDLELYDLITITHTLPGWVGKKFLVTGKSEDQYGRMKFILAAYYSGIYDDAEAADQASYESDLPNPFDPPGASTGIGLALVSPGTGFDYDAVKVTFTPPDDPFYAYTEIYISNNDATYYLAGTSSGEDFVIQGMGMFYVPGNTCYVKLKNVNEMGVFGTLSAAESIVITSSIRLGSFYAGLYDFWGGNAAIGNAATKIVLGNLDGTPKIALGASADAITYAGTQAGFFVDGDGYFRVGGSNHGLRFNPVSGVLDVPTKVKVGSGTYLDIDGANARIRSSNYVSGMAGAGFTLEPDLLEVGNIRARGMIRTAVFQKDIISAVGGNLAVLPADVLDTDIAASADLVTDGTFDNACGVNWACGDGWDIGVTHAGKAHCDGSQVANSNLEQNAGLTIGHVYRVSVTISNYAAGSLIPHAGGAGNGTPRAANGTFHENITCAGNGIIYMLATPAFIGSIDDVEYYDLTTNVIIEGNETFAVNDLLRIKDNTDDEWFKVTNAAGAPTYVVTRDQGNDYEGAARPAWKKGATVVNYRQSGDGFVYMTASETNAPFLAVYTHAGAPWTTLTTHLRIGNLNGYLGYAADIYGIAMGTANDYIKIDPTNGIIISIGQANGITIKNGADILMELSDASPALIKWSTIHNLGAASTTARGLCIWPTIGDQDAFQIGYDPVNNVEKKYSGIVLEAYNKISYRASFDNTHNAHLYGLSSVAANYLYIQARHGAVYAKVNLNADSDEITVDTGDFRPLATNDVNFGNTTYRWKHGWLVDLTVTNCITEGTCEIIPGDALKIIADIVKPGSKIFNEFGHERFDMARLQPKYPWLFVNDDGEYLEKIGTKSDLLYQAVMQLEERLKKIEDLS